MSHFKTNRSIGLFLIRIGIGGIFLSAGLAKLMNPGMSLGGFLGFGAGLYWAVAIVETLGGLSMILGFFSRYAGVLLAVVMAMAFFKLTFTIDYFDPRLTIMLFFASLGIAFSGPGSYAVGKHACGCMGVCPCPKGNMCDCSCDSCKNCTECTASVNMPKA